MKPYKVPKQSFDAYNKDSPVQTALGSTREQGRKESGSTRSVNWMAGVSGWRITPRGIELGNPAEFFASAVLPATGTVDDSNKIFTFTRAPAMVIVNGAIYIESHGYSLSGTTVTLDNVVGTSGFIFALG